MLACVIVLALLSLLVATESGAEDRGPHSS